MGKGDPLSPLDRAIHERNEARKALRAIVDYFDTAEWRMVDAHEWRPLRQAAMAALAINEAAP